MNFLQSIIFNIISNLIYDILKKHHKIAFIYVGKLLRFSYIYAIPLIFILTTFIDPKYNLQEKHIFAIGFCGLAITFGYLYKLAESIDDNQ